jgi:CRP/FNR family transcriptional regulator, cyclic AMP receptor protein
MRRNDPQKTDPIFRDVFTGIPDGVVERLKHAGEEHSLEAGERVPPVTEALVRVESGLVKLAVMSDNRSLTVALFGPNDTICAPLFHSWANDLFYIEAQEPSVVRVLPQQAVLAAAEEHPELGRSLMRQLSWATWSLMNTIHMLTFYNLPQRVAQVLVNLAAIFGVPDEKGGLRLGLRFTQEELADLAGARRETLSTVLQDFREDDVLDLRYARIDIKDMEALKQIAGAEALPFLGESR